MLSFKQKKQNSILGIALEGRFVQLAVLRRPNGDFQLHRVARAELSLDPLTSDPALVGRELRKHLDAAGIREKQCAVSLPLNWALTLQTKLPQIQESDVPGFLTIQAERGFPYGLDELVIVNSRYRSPDGGEQATLIAIPKGHLDRIEQVLKAAGLRPASFSLNIAALADPASNESGVVALLIRNEHAELHVLSSGGILVLRTLEGVVTSEHEPHGINADSIAREIRITLGQLPKEFRDSLDHVKVIGPGDQIRAVAQELAARCSSLGLKIEAAPIGAPGLGERFKLNGAPLPAAVAVAARRIQSPAPPLEFLTPKPSAWSRRLSGFSSRQLVWAALAGAVALFIAAAAFVWQYWSLSQLESTWRTLEPRVVAIESQQQQIRKFRPWYNESILSLRILRKLTESFPEDGAVTAKSIEIKYPAVISCSGTAKDNQSLLNVLEQLRSSPQVNDLTVDQLRGKSPLQFTFRFNWIEGGPNEIR